MTFEIEVAGASRTVEVRRSNGAWLVTLEGRQLTADVSKISGHHWSLLLGSPDGDAARSYEITITSDGPSDLIVHVNGHPVAASVAGARDRRPRARVQQGGDASGSVPKALRAPMPGRILKVLVAAGQEVAARQGLVVVEAMKMENELRAPAAAIVREVRVTEGMSVEANTILLVLEPRG